MWVDFDEAYKGDTFFPADPTRRGWVPVHPLTVSETLSGRHGEKMQVSRTQLPLQLAWCWTIWKSQGQTYRDKVVIDLSNKEPDHGVTYVALSRATKFENIGIIGGLSKQRFINSVRDHKKMQPRLKEEERLALLEEATIARVIEQRLRDAEADSDMDTDANSIE